MSDNGITADQSQVLLYATEIRELYLAEKDKVAELAAAKAKVEETLKRLVEAERLREEFISNCSHELRTPLVPIIGWAQVMERREMPLEQVKEFAAVISSHGHRLLAVVESLLAISQIQRGHERILETHRTDMAELISEAAEASNDQQRRFQLRIGDGARYVFVHRPYVEKVLRSLLSNAYKFSPHDTAITIGVDRFDNKAVVSVIDAGTGVPTDERDRIFEPFVQGDGSTTRAIGGLGAGLFIARELVHAIGGRIWIEDTPGGGATFKFSLPQRRAKDECPDLARRFT